MMADVTSLQQINLTSASAHKLENLRISTKQLLCLIEKLQSKTHSSDKDDSPQLTDSLRKDSPISLALLPKEIISSVAAKTLEIQTKTLDDIYIQDKKDDCSVFKRLTRECHCLNKVAYNDFIIHFNEDTKYITTTRGEIIKNMKITKKFLYMGGKYTKNALTFLHDGLMNSQHSERLEIVQACVYADICNVFDDKSIVTVCILWPEFYENYGDSTSQKMAADIIVQLILVEEGRRYLTFSSKITCDIKKLLKRKSNSFSPELIESLNLILSSLTPPLTRNINVSYYMKGQEGNSYISKDTEENQKLESAKLIQPVFKKRHHLTIAYIVDNEITDSLPTERGSAYRTLQTLSRYIMYLTVDEITVHLELLHSLSKQEEGKKELLQNFYLLLKVFKQMLLEFDISELIKAVTNILNNLLTQSNGDTVSESPKSYVVSEISTEPVRMISEIQQYPSPRKKSPRRTFGASRNRVPVVIKIPSNVPENTWSNPRYNDKPTKGFQKCSGCKGTKNKGLKSSVIIIPIEKLKRINK